MAVTVANLVSALRLTTDATGAVTASETIRLTRLLGAVNAVVQRYAPEAPEQVRDEAIVLMAAYIYDQTVRGGGNLVRIRVPEQRRRQSALSLALAGARWRLGDDQGAQRCRFRRRRGRRDARHARGRDRRSTAPYRRR